MTTTTAPPPAAETPATSSPTAEAKPASAAKTSTKAKAKAPPPEEGPLSQRQAVDFLKQRREQRTKLRLAAADGEPVTTSDEPTPTDDVATPLTPDEGVGSEGDPDAETAPEVEPTWAQKLRTDLSKKTERVTELEQQHAQREAKFAEAHRAVSHRVEDLQADMAAEQAYSQMLEQAIAEAGLTVPADWKRAMQAERKAAALERQLKRGQTAERSQGHEKAAAAAQQQLSDLGKTVPEIAAALAGKDPEARAWLAERFAVDDKGRPVGLGMKNLERDAIAFAKALRWDRRERAEAQKRQTPAAARPAERARPQATTLGGAGNAASAKRVPTVPKNEKESAAWLAARRASRK